MIVIIILATAVILTLNKNNPGMERDSSGHGNYGESKIKTGSQEEYALNNIYDMAGNIWERTMEAYTSTYRTSRGSSCRYTGQHFPLSTCSPSTLDNFNEYLGGRCQLYIK